MKKQRNNLSKLSQEERKEYLRRQTLVRVKRYNEANKDLIKEKKKLWRQKNIDTIKKREKKYRDNNKEKIKNRVNANFNKKYKTDFSFKLKVNIKNLIKATFKNKNYNKSSKTQKILGCNITDFKLYLESKFEPWMNWDNHGKYNGQLNYGWDLDHIIPISSATNEEEFLKLNHFTNFQPLCSKINRVIKRSNLS